MEQIILTGVNLNELLERIGQIIESKFDAVSLSKKEIENRSKFISRFEVAALLKISLPTLNDWTKLGWLKSYKMGNRVLYKADEVESALCKVSANKHKKGVSHA